MTSPSTAAGSPAVPQVPMTQVDNSGRMYTSSMSSPSYVHPALQTTQSPFDPAPSSQYPQAVSDGARVVPQTAHGVYGPYGPNGPRAWLGSRRVRESKL